MIKFTSKLCGSVEAEIIAVLNKANIQGLDFSGATRSYGQTETTFKIVATIKGTQTRKEAGLELYCDFHDIDPKQKGKKGETIIDYRPKAHKHKLVYRTVRGAEYIIGAADWKRRILKIAA